MTLRHQLQSAKSTASEAQRHTFDAIIGRAPKHQARLHEKIESATAAGGT